MSTVSYIEAVEACIRFLNDDDDDDDDEIGVLLKWLDGSSWFLARMLLSISPTLC